MIMATTKTAGLFIFRKDGKLLICHPTNHPSGFYTIPKGKLEEGEVYLDCAFRETYEETNLDLKNSADFHIYYLGNKDYENKNKRLYAFLLAEKQDSQFDWDSVELKCNSFVNKKNNSFPEIDGYKWVSIQEASGSLHEAQTHFFREIYKISM